MQKEEGLGVPENKKNPQIGNTLCAQSEDTMTVSLPRYLSILSLYD